MSTLENPTPTQERTPMGRAKKPRATVHNRSANRRLRNNGSRMGDVPVAVKIALDLNRRNAEFIEKRFGRLMFVWAIWRESRLRRTNWRGGRDWEGLDGHARGIVTDQIDYKCFSFSLWLLEDRCGWREVDMRPDEFHDLTELLKVYRGVWGWWLCLDRAAQLDVVRARRFYR